MIKGRDKVLVYSTVVDHPVAVRYGWADYPIVNLWNKAGLPASPSARMISTSGKTG